MSPYTHVTLHACHFTIDSVPSSLILNADDFGLTPGVNRAIAELADAGAITSATLMAAGLAFDDAVKLALARPHLGVGCHITFIDGTPLSHPADIPTLLGPDGKHFRTSLVDFFLAVLRGRVREEEIAREAMAQVQRLQRAGIDVTHVDTHKHTHLLPAVARPLLWLCERAGVGAIRNPFEPAWARKLEPADVTRRLLVRVVDHFRPQFFALPQIREGVVATTEGTIGVSATGNLNRSTLQQILRAMPDAGLFELVTHPGYNDTALDSITTRLRATREVERLTLLETFSSSAEISPHPRLPELISYAALGSYAAARATGRYVPPSGHEFIL
jgi:predicted glycoside hydrolase/deacetylase ChbG (UPF0249 family)